MAYGNHEIPTQIQKRTKKFIPYQDLNHGLLLPKASVLQMSYSDPLVYNALPGFLV